MELKIKNINFKTADFLQRKSLRLIPQRNHSLNVGFNTNETDKLHFNISIFSWLLINKETDRKQF